MDIVRISFLGIMTALLYALIRHLKPEIAPLVVLGGTAVVFVMLTERFLDVQL